MTPAEFYGKCWNILVEHAGANPKPIAKKDFVLSMLGSCHEYRFCGSLGFGGKFYRFSPDFYVQCYPEDVTPERQKAIDKVNHLLKALVGDLVHEQGPNDRQRL